MKPFLHILSLLAVPSTTMAFVAHPPLVAMRRAVRVASSEEDDQSLIVDGEEMQDQMQNLKSKYPTSEADYLAAARERAKNKPSSQPIRATVEDFQKVAEEKREKFGEFNEWEGNMEEEEDLESQILLPELPDENDDGEGGAEPKLLL